MGCVGAVFASVGMDEEGMIVARADEIALELVEIGRKLRAAQKEFWDKRRKTASSQSTAMSLERQYDAKLKEYDEARETLPGIFGRAGS
jgi:hypothetical protein